MPEVYQRQALRDCGGGDVAAQRAPPPRRLTRDRRRPHHPGMDRHSFVHTSRAGTALPLAADALLAESIHAANLDGFRQGLRACGRVEWTGTAIKVCATGGFLRPARRWLNTSSGIGPIDSPWPVAGVPIQRCAGRRGLAER
jgi:hypothetical protein